MCRRKKKIVEAPKREMTPEETLDSFQLKKPEPAYDAEGKRDYFTEYYQAYKNDYIDQYLDAYKKFKNEGAIPTSKPVDVKLEEKKEEQEVPVPEDQDNK